MIHIFLAWPLLHSSPWLLRRRIFSSSMPCRRNCGYWRGPLWSNGDRILFNSRFWIFELLQVRHSKPTYGAFLHLPWFKAIIVILASPNISTKYCFAAMFCLQWINGAPDEMLAMFTLLTSSSSENHAHGSYRVTFRQDIHVKLVSWLQSHNNLLVTFCQYTHIMQHFDYPVLH